MNKIQIETVVRFEKAGGLRPLWIVWEDGRKFEVDKVKYVDRVPSRAGVIFPICYTCIVQGRELKLYFDAGTLSWFLAGKERE